MGSILPCCLPCGKAGGLQILCCQGFEVNDYNFTLDALALKPSDFCNVGLLCLGISEFDDLSMKVNPESNKVSNLFHPTIQKKYE
jgi:hypothetical protein